MLLSGQEYVDVYASTMKERLSAARRPRTGPAAVVVAAGSAPARAAAGTATGTDGAPVRPVSGASAGGDAATPVE